MAKVLLPLAPGVEEMEAVILIDVFRRAQWQVVAAGVAPGPVTASRGVCLVPDALWDDVRPAEFDVLALPGGNGGTACLCRDRRVLAAVREFMASGRWVAAICAAPLVLQAAGVLAGRKVTCYPGVEKELMGVEHRKERVVWDGRLITSQGPGTTFEFALAVVAALDGQAQADALARGLALAPRK